MDIVERLMQQIETGPDVEDIAFINPDGPDAVDEIERLEDEIERLREALNKMQRSRDRYRQAWETEKTRSTILQKERGDESYQ